MTQCHTFEHWEIECIKCTDLQLRDLSTEETSQSLINTKFNQRTEKKTIWVHKDFLLQINFGLVFFIWKQVTLKTEDSSNKNELAERTDIEGAITEFLLFYQNDPIKKFAVLENRLSFTNLHPIHPSLMLPKFNDRKMCENKLEIKVWRIVVDIDW